MTRIEALTREHAGTVYFLWVAETLEDAVRQAEANGEPEKDRPFAVWTDGERFAVGDAYTAALHGFEDVALTVE